jgi:hypothetical protein
VDSAPLVFNGLDGATGAYLHTPTTAEELADSVYGVDVQAGSHQRELEIRAAHDEPTFGVAYPASAENLDEAGWGVVTAADASPDTLAALDTLCSLRRDQAGRLFRVFTGADGVCPGEGKDEWLGRHGMGDGEAEPEKVPYYLMLVGGPDEIPFEFQYELDVVYAVGRVAFDTPGEYARYADVVAAAEQAGPPDQRTLSLFGPENPDDAATALSATDLLRPIGPEVRQTAKKPFTLTDTIGAEADKAALCRLLWSEAAPDLLFTASHGVGFAPGHPLQREIQGALVCQDWPGPVAWKGKAIDDAFLVSAGDVPTEADSSPSLVFAFACYGAGTPRLDDFGHLRRKKARTLAAAAFVARLPQRLLTQAGGRTVAFIGHIERAWEWSFVTPHAGAQRGPFVSTLATLLDGWRVGHALEALNARYAGRAATLTGHLNTYAKSRLKIKPAEMAELWMATNDARNYAVLGDPAVRMSRSA